MAPAGSDFALENELLVDFVATEPNVALSNVTTFTAAPGGAPANVFRGRSSPGTDL
jgi:hypothetical protein